MELLKFLAWWWGKRDGPERAGSVFIFLMVSIVPMCLLFGVKGLVIVLITLLSLVVLGVVWLFCFAVKEQWIKYHKEKELEAQRIIDRLSGESRW